ncbi:hypothetical protein C7E13_21910 [Stenotrophomonas maltophilia]|nr:hypothetical protein C7E13_21910 [Stenotrophomonas maltophilia]
MSLRSSPLVASSAEPEPMFAAAADALPLEAMAPQELTPALYEAAAAGRACAAGVVALQPVGGVQR